MGNCLAGGTCRSSHSRGVLLLGLDGAGATTILYQLVLGKRLETIPTLGVNREIISAEGMELECWDIGGMDKMRPLWPRYARDSDGVIFVVDATDIPRMRLAAEELSKLYSSASRKNLKNRHHPLLIFANKQDLPHAATPDQVHKIMKISSLPVQVVKIFPCSVNDRQTLLTGVSWLTGQLKGRKPVANSRASL